MTTLLQMVTDKPRPASCFFRHGLALQAAAGLLAVVAALAAPSDASAQSNWPSRAVTIIVPYSAGTTPDVMARQLADQLSSRIGQPVVVEDRPGAGGLVGTEYAAGMKPDGYSIFLGGMDTQAIIGHLYRNITIDPLTAFAGVSLLGEVDNVVSASPLLGIQSMMALIEEGQKGRSFTFATPGVGSNPHLLGELLKQRTGIDLVHVPYSQASTGYTDAMAGRVDLVISGLPPVANLLASNKLVPLVTTAAKRLPSLPNTPTMVELGYPNFISVTWFAVLAPAGTPRDIIAKLSSDVQAITTLEPYRTGMEKVLVSPLSSSPAQLDALAKSDWARMGDIITRAHIVLP